MLLNAKAVDFVLLKMAMCYVTCPRYHNVCYGYERLQKSEKIEDHEGSKFYFKNNCGLATLLKR